MWEIKKEKNGSLDKRDVLGHCSRFTVSGTSEQKTSNKILVAAEAISAAAATGCTLQLIPLRVPFPVY